jgi:hypothetical protein
MLTIFREVYIILLCKTLKYGISANPKNLPMCLLSCVDNDVLVCWNCRLAGEIMRFFTDICSILAACVCPNIRQHK